MAEPQSLPREIVGLGKVTELERVAALVYHAAARDRKDPLRDSSFRLQNCSR